MKLSEHFTLEEFTKNSHHIENIPNAVQIANLQALCDNVLEEIRKHFGPVTINSGFRCQDLNRVVGGAIDSQHLSGEAADIEVYGIRNDDIFNFIVDRLNFDQAIAERFDENDGSAGWVHVSYAHKNRRDILSCPSPKNYIRGLVYKS